MIRRNLLMASAIIASVVTTACSDTTGPKDLASGQFLGGVLPAKRDSPCREGVLDVHRPRR